VIRSFVGIAPPDAVRDRLEDLGLRLEEGRPVPWDNLHLTLAFLGDLTGPALEDVALEIDAIDDPAPEVAIEGVGVFGPAGRPRSAHARVRPTAELSALREAVRRAARRGGRELPRERFVPHVTVARFSGKSPAGEGLARWLAREAAFACAPFRAESLRIWRSDRTEEGPVYTELMETPLA